MSDENRLDVAEVVDGHRNLIRPRDERRKGHCGDQVNPQTFPRRHSLDHSTASSQNRTHNRPLILTENGGIDHLKAGPSGRGAAHLHACPLLGIAADLRKQSIAAAERMEEVHQRQQGVAGGIAVGKPVSAGAVGGE